MFVLINVASMAVLHRHADVRVLRNLAHIECANCSTSLFEETDSANYNSFGEDRLKLLYEVSSGEKCNFRSRETLTANLIGLLMTIEPTIVNSFELNLHARQIKDNDFRHYKYVIGSKSALELETPIAEIPRMGCLARATPYTHAHAHKNAPVALTVPAIAPTFTHIAPPITRATWSIDATQPPAKIPPPWLKK